MVDEDLRALERVVEAGVATPDEIARWTALKLRGGCAFGAHSELILAHQQPVLGVDPGLDGTVVVSMPAALVCSACGQDVGLRLPPPREER